jgi:hypothetical protein
VLSHGCAITGSGSFGTRRRPRFSEDALPEYQIGLALGRVAGDSLRQSSMQERRFCLPTEIPAVPSLPADLLHKIVRSRKHSFWWPFAISWKCCHQSVGIGGVGRQLCCGADRPSRVSDRRGDVTGAQAMRRCDLLVMSGLVISTPAAVAEMFASYPRTLGHWRLVEVRARAIE